MRTVWVSGFIAMELVICLVLFARSIALAVSKAIDIGAVTIVKEVDNAVPNTNNEGAHPQHR